MARIGADSIADLYAEVYAKPADDHVRRVWLGRLRDIVIPLAYERGFLASCVLLVGTTGILDYPEWATIHTMDLGELESQKFEIGPTMRSLRTLVGVASNRATALEASHKHLTIKRRGGARRR